MAYSSESRKLTDGILFTHRKQRDSQTDRERDRENEIE